MVKEGNNLKVNDKAISPTIQQENDPYYFTIIHNKSTDIDDKMEIEKQ